MKMKNKIDINKLLKISAYIVVSVAILIGIAYSVVNSDFTKIKKYDEKDSKARKDIPISKEKQRYAAAQYYSTAIKIQNNGMISLGDFTMNLTDGRVLTANISVKYNSSKSWFSSEESDIVSKSGVLRNSVINAMHGSSAITNNTEVKNRIKRNLNKYLSEGEVEEVYFNKFIIN